MAVLQNHCTIQIPLVSVIIPTYNRARFIEEAIQSVLEQTFKDFEVIIIDDGSSDETQQVISQIKDSRLIYHYQDNGGRSKARNYALTIAKGKYITFLDSDDLYMADKLKIQVNYLDSHPDIYMVYTSAHCIDEDGNLAMHNYIADVGGWIYSKIAFLIPITITLPTVMVRREVFDKVGNFDENLHRFEDVDMWRRISKLYQIGTISKFTCKIRTHQNNSLENQDHEEIKLSLNYYASKIMKDDKEFDIKLRKKGIAKLYRYYGYYISQTPQFRKQGEEFYKIANSFHRLNSITIIIKKVYYKVFNILYKIYNLLKKLVKNPI